MLTGANEMDRQSKQNHSLLTPTIMMYYFYDLVKNIDNETAFMKIYPGFPKLCPG